MIKTNLLIIILLIGFLGNAQNFTGRAIYKSTIKTINSDESNHDAHVLSLVKQILSSDIEKDYELIFNSSESIYKQQVTLERPRSSMFSFSNSSEGCLYKDLSKKLSIEKREVFGKKFLIADSIIDFKWELLNETTQIGKYICNKARTTILTTNLDSEDIEEIGITAWYAKEIPVTHGPQEFCGLPGLILKIETEIEIISCIKIEITSNKNSTIKKPSGGKILSRQEFNAIVKDKIEEIKLINN